ncbi:hypothetical protein G6F37_004687 [Rhizopus arrhizus]|nr:hypothetical protein G6F38_004773 [Rhizopus arrhizus]KAG1159660.1 hypothetical protein G6F37_004687 [Rhizopus arrhizus]
MNPFDKNQQRVYDQAVEGLLKLKTLDSQISLNSTSTGCSYDSSHQYRLPPVSQILLSIDYEDNVEFARQQPLSLCNFPSSSSLSSIASVRKATESRRRGRPKRSDTEFNKKRHSDHSFASQKPRWNDAERQELLEAIVREKNLDDMSTICWERIAAVVGRATKACKDQWRREVLPNIRSRFSSEVTSNKKTKKTIHSDVGTKSIEFL